MKYHLFQNKETEQLFANNKLATFSELWELESEWFEEPNQRRNGWSGVIKYSLTDDKGDAIPVFIKRQENHNHKTLLHPVKGVPTFRREYFNILRLQQKSVPTIEPLYYGERLIKGNAQSILITRSLEGYISFEELFELQKLPPADTLQKIMQTAGQTVRLMHNANYRHGALFPKHFFTRYSDNEVDVRLIDLEKLKWLPFKNRLSFNDLSRVIRRRPTGSRDEFNILIDAYLSYGEDLSNSSLARKLYALSQRINH